MIILIKIKKIKNLKLNKISYELRVTNFELKTI